MKKKFENKRNIYANKWKFIRTILPIYISILAFKVLNVKFQLIKITIFLFRKVNENIYTNDHLRKEKKRKKQNKNKTKQKTLKEYTCLYWILSK